MENRTGKTYIAPNLKKESTMIDKEGNEIIIEKPKQNQTIQEYLERRRKMRGHA